MRIRPATDRDFDALTDIWDRAARIGHGFMSDEDFTEGRCLIRDGLLPSMEVLICEDDQARPIGFIGTHQDRVELLYVDPTFHGRGVGTILLEAVGGPQGPSSVQVYEGNVAGLGFYQAHGFRPIRTHPQDAFGRPFPVIQLQRRTEAS